MKGKERKWRVKIISCYKFLRCEETEVLDGWTEDFVRLVKGQGRKGGQVIKEGEKKKVGGKKGH